jgi:PAS domain S-box-containing protein/diguanylate cyclase (GGDEF)-like protein
MNAPHRIDLLAEAAEAQLSSLVRGSDDAIIATDLDGVVTAWSRGAEDLYGYTAAEAVGRHISMVYLDPAIAPVSEVLAQIRSEQSVVTEGRRRRRDGSLVDVEIRISPILDHTGAVIGASSIARDVTERHRHEEELRDSRELLEWTQAIGHIGGWKNQPGAEAVIVCTPEVYRITGLEPGTTLRNADLFGLVHPEDRVQFIDAIATSGPGAARIDVETRIVRRDGSIGWVQFVAESEYDESGAVHSRRGVIQDITARKEAELRLEYDALHDQLTGLPNRALFLDRIPRAELRSHLDGLVFAVFYLNLDRFKLFNDVQGNERGDELLRAVAERISGALPPTDTVARFGADEFGLICENLAGASAAVERAEDVLAAFTSPFVCGGVEVAISASVGITMGGSGSAPDTLTRDANLAMQRAKESGGNRVELYDLRLRHQVEERFALETALRNALVNDELFLEFQPVVSLSEGRFVAAEALIRWNSPVHGVLHPDEFISVAEETGLIIPIGTWVLETACQELARWRAHSPELANCSVAVNVAASQLHEPDLPEIIEAALRRAGLDGGALRIELTESSLVEGGRVIEVLERIRALGVRTSIDDFGTRYSSLSYLVRLPIDELKIDRLFVAGLGHDDSSEAVITAILAIGRSLNLPVIAEGVETADQLEVLARLGCDWIQGFHFAKPLSAPLCAAALSGPLRATVSGLRPLPLTPNLSVVGARVAGRRRAD